MDIKNLDLKSLKAIAYDLISNIEILKSDLAKVVTQIVKLKEEDNKKKSKK